MRGTIRRANTFSGSDRRGALTEAVGCAVMALVSWYLAWKLPPGSGERTCEVIMAIAFTIVSACWGVAWIKTPPPPIARMVRSPRATRLMARDYVNYPALKGRACSSCSLLAVGLGPRVGG